MHSLAVAYAYTHMTRVALDRRTQSVQSTSSLRRRLTSVAATVRSAFTEPIVAQGSVSPTVH